jgi:hypothetical protein
MRRVVWSKVSQGTVKNHFTLSRALLFLVVLVKVMKENYALCRTGKVPIANGLSRHGELGQRTGAFSERIGSI